MASPLLAWQGPVAEESFPGYYELIGNYNTFEEGAPLNTADSAYGAGKRVALVTETFEIPPSNVDEIKRAIMSMVQ